MLDNLPPPIDSYPDDLGPTTRSSIVGHATKRIGKKGGMATPHKSRTTSEATRVFDQGRETGPARPGTSGTGATYASVGVSCDDDMPASPGHCICMQPGIQTKTAGQKAGANAPDGVDYLDTKNHASLGNRQRVPSTFQMLNMWRGPFWCMGMVGRCITSFLGSCISLGVVILVMTLSVLVSRRAVVLPLIGVL